MIYTLYYVKDTGSKRDRQEHYYGILTDLNSIEPIKESITKKFGSCLFGIYTNVNSVFSYGEMIK